MNYSLLTLRNSSLVFIGLAQFLFLSCATQVDDSTLTKKDIHPPKLKEVTAVPTYTNNTSPSYTFDSTEACFSDS